MLSLSADSSAHIGKQDDGGPRRGAEDPDDVSEVRAEGGEVLLNKSDRDRIGADLVKLFKGTALTLSDETVDIEGGCILRRGKISYNASLEKLLSNAREELTAEVAGILFK